MAEYALEVSNSPSGPFAVNQYPKAPTDADMKLAFKNLLYTLPKGVYMRLLRRDSATSDWVVFDKGNTTSVVGEKVAIGTEMLTLTVKLYKVPDPLYVASPILTQTKDFKFGNEQDGIAFLDSTLAPDYTVDDILEVYNGPKLVYTRHGTRASEWPRNFGLNPIIAADVQAKADEAAAKVKTLDLTLDLNIILMLAIVIGLVCVAAYLVYKHGVPQPAAPAAPKAVV